MKKKNNHQPAEKILTLAEGVELIQDAIAQEELIFAVFSIHPTSNPKKIKVEPLKLKGKPGCQITEFYDNKVKHFNFSLNDLNQALIQYMQAGFQEILLRRSRDELLMKKFKEGWCLRSCSKEEKKPQWEHNRGKSYPIPEGIISPSLTALGIMDHKGKLFDSGRNKFTQINRFLEMVSDVLPEKLPQPFIIADLGCGKAYLSFALYEWLALKKHHPIKLTGIDLKGDLVAENQQLADQLAFSGMKFQESNIASYYYDPIHMIICLHACDTATDEAILKGVGLGAQWIFAAPCCQHELYDQLHHPLLQPLWKHGILKEKASSLLTDAFRALYLEAMGYKVQVMEFIDARHSPKNILIRAIKTQEAPSKKKIEACIHWAKALDLQPFILRELF